MKRRESSGRSWWGERGVERLGVIMEVIVNGILSFKLSLGFNT